MKLKVLASMLPAAAFLMACAEDSTITNVNDEAKEKANITLMIVDMNSGLALDSVNVLSMTSNKQATTDANGLVTWKSNEIGDYAYTISKNGYATQTIVVSLAEQGKGDVARVGDVYTKISMTKAGVVAKGNVLYKDDATGNLKAAAGIKVYAKLPSNFVPCEYTTLTDASGAYSFTNLPEGVTSTISVGQTTIENKLYGSTTTNTVTNRRAGDLVNLAPIQMGFISGSILLVSDNTDKVDTTTTVTLTFSTPIKADSLNANKVRVTQGGTTSILTKIALDADGKTVKIAPFSGKWQKGTSYTISGTVYSTDGAQTTFSKSFIAGSTTGALPAHVTGLKAEKYSSTSVQLSWTAPLGTISGYYLYYKTDKMADFARYTSISSSYTSGTYTLSYFGTGITSVEFVILPYNGVGMADMNTAIPVKYVIPTTVVDPIDDI